MRPSTYFQGSGLVSNSLSPVGAVLEVMKIVEETRREYDIEETFRDCLEIIPEEM